MTDSIETIEPIEAQGNGKPHRAVEITIHVGGDDWQFAKYELAWLVFHIDKFKELGKSTGGGGACGHWIKIETHPEMTHEEYHRQLDLYLAGLRVPA